MTCSAHVECSAAATHPANLHLNYRVLPFAFIIEMEIKLPHCNFAVSAIARSSMVHITLVLVLIKASRCREVV
jgi:hypothetical protein